MSSVLAPLLRIEERALRIGLRLKRSSEREIGFPKLLRFTEPLGGGERVPLGPFRSDELFRVEFLHALTYSQSAQNRVTSVKLNSRTFIAGTTMSADSSPVARTG